MGSLSLLQGIFPTQELNRVSGFIALQVDSLPTELSEHNLSKIPVKSEFNWIHNWKNFLYSYTIKYQMICLTWSGNIMIHRHCILWIRLAFVFTINEPQKQFLRGSRPVFTGSTMSNECARWCSIMNNGATNTKQEELGGFSWWSQVALVVKNQSANAGDLRDAGLIPGLGRSPGGENGNQLQYYCLENPMDRRAWQAMVHRATKSRTRLSDFTYMYPGSSVPKTPGSQCKRPGFNPSAGN